MQRIIRDALPMARVPQLIYLAVVDIAVQNLGSFWAASGQPLGSFWTASRQLLGSFWTASGQFLGSFWAASGQLKQQKEQP
jgi:hypothetical protein